MAGFLLDVLMYFFLVFQLGELFIVSLKDNYLGNNRLALVTCEVRQEIGLLLSIHCCPGKYLMDLDTHKAQYRVEWGVLLAHRET